MAAWRQNFGGIFDSPMEENGSKRRRGSEGGNGDAAGSSKDDLGGLREQFTDLFRDHLFLKTHVHQQLSGLLLVIVIADTESQQNMLKLLTTYNNAMPNWEADPRPNTRKAANASSCGTAS